MSEEEYRRADSRALRACEIISDLPGVANASIFFINGCSTASFTLRFHLHERIRLSTGVGGVVFLSAEASQKPASNGGKVDHLPRYLPISKAPWKRRSVKICLVQPVSFASREVCGSFVLRGFCRKPES